MTKINSIKNIASKFIKPKKLPPEVALIEKSNGMAYALTRPRCEVEETLLRESALGHIDFVEGALEALSKNAAKSLYKK